MMLYIIKILGKGMLLHLESRILKHLYFKKLFVKWEQSYPSKLSFVSVSQSCVESMSLAALR